MPGNLRADRDAPRRSVPGSRTMTAGGRVLVCGATGFVGRALVVELVRLGVTVRILSRQPGRARQGLPAGVECVEGDLVEGSGLKEALEGVPVAYYLVHSLGPQRQGLDFAEADRRAADHFAGAARESGLGRIVYVGGLGDDAPTTSRHLASRREVARLLGSSSVPVTQLRAGIIIGAGGSSFEMMVQLVEKLPVMICPRWIDSRCQPIALEDLVRYLVGCLDETRTLGRSFDVGGPDILPYSEMLLRVGAALGRRPMLVVLPRFTPGLSAHWVGYITDVPAELARPIIDGMYLEAVCHEGAIREILPGPLRGLDRALEIALEERRRSGPVHRLRGGHPPGPWEGRILRLDRSRYHLRPLK